MRRVLVTGAAGFIGSHLVARLLEDGMHVVMLDNLSSGCRKNIDDVVDSAPTGASSEFIELDIATGPQEELTNACKGCDYVFHLAALADIVPSIQHPLRYHESNVEGTVRLLEAVRRAGGTRKLVYAASSSCYGIPDDYPTSESAEPRPQYPYALTKYVGEQYVLHWCQTYDIPSVSMRFFNVYGPRSRTTGAYGAVFGVFLAQKLAEKPFTVVGDGTQTRDFVYVTDVAEALLRAAQANVSGEVYNVGTGHPQSVNHLCDLLNGPKTYVAKRPGEPDCTWADIRKIREALDWEPIVSFEEGTSRMLSEIDAWQEAPVWTPNTIEEATADWFKHLDKKPTGKIPQPAQS